MKKWILLSCLVGSIFSHVIGQDIYIPDANFKAYLLNNKEINTNGDKAIQQSEAINFKGDISCVNTNIKDFTGIEYFTQLHALESWDNPITSINLSKNKALKSLAIQKAPIKNLNIEGLNQLQELVISDTYIADLNIEGKHHLQKLYLSNSLIENLDFTALTNLKELNVSHMNIATIDLSKTPYLHKLVLVNNFSLNRLNLANKNHELLEEVYIIDNNQLNCIEVNNVDYIQNKIHPEDFFIEEHISLSTSCK